MPNKLKVQLVMLAIALGAGALTVAFSDGGVDFLSSAEVELQVDGHSASLEHQGRRWWARVSPGTHELRERAAGEEWRTFQVTVGRDEELLVPAVATQCFVVLNRDRWVRVQQRLPEATPTALGRSVAFGREALVNHNVNAVVLDLPCAELRASSDEELVQRKW